jgi:hypothetical protein
MHGLELLLSRTLIASKNGGIGSSKTRSRD